MFRPNREFVRPGGVGRRSWLFALAVASGCAAVPPDAGTPPPGSTQTAESPLYADTSKVWTGGIQVCFEQPGFATERAWVRDAIDRSWSAVTNLNTLLIGWGTCASASLGVRIMFQDARGVTEGLGIDINGVPNGMKLNTWATFDGNCVAGWTRERCVRSTAVHEFGHALGFAHEHDRSDRPASCTEGSPTASGDMFVGLYDGSSVMNYCNSVRNNDGALSPTDAVGAAQFYGRRWAGFGPVIEASKYVCLPGEDCRMGDVTGDGIDEIVVFVKDSQPGAMRGSVWVLQHSKVNGQVAPQYDVVVKGHNFFCHSNEDCRLGDIDGDGRADLVVFTKGASHQVWAALSNGDGTFGPANRVHNDFCRDGEQCEVINVTTPADGADLVAFVKSTQGEPAFADVWVAASHGKNASGVVTFADPPTQWSDFFCYGDEECRLGDVNNDGAADAIVFTKGTHQEVWVGVSTGGRFIQAVQWHDDFCRDGEICEVGDITGDGRVDLISFARGPNGDGTNGDVRIAYNLAGSFGPWKKAHEFFCKDNEACRVGKVNNDNKADVLTFTRNASAPSVWISFAGDLGL